VTTFLLRLTDPGGPGVRLAVKDCIDIAGEVTTVGSPVVAEQAAPAVADAACLAGARAAGARIVGKTNLHELCFGASGVNPWYGTPENPLDAGRIPGGSSSGSAVAVATGEADVAFGTDTAGSIRNPAAHCGVYGLKTTFGRIGLDGVWPLGPSMDTVGPFAMSVAGIETGMALLEPGFVRSAEAPRRIGRLRLDGTEPAFDAAVDAALAAIDVEVVEIALDGWAAATQGAVTVLLAEALESDRWIADGHLDRIGTDVRERFATASTFPPDALPSALALRERWRAELDRAFATVDLIALPSSLKFAAPLEQLPVPPNGAALAVSLAGIPALAQPLPIAGHHLKASLQLIGPDGSEDRLVTAAAMVEAAVGLPG
jgi:amidase